MKQIARKLATLALCAALASSSAAPAFARSVAIEDDGKTYICYQYEAEASEGIARFEIDGKTFLIGEDEAIIQEPGKPDRRVALNESVSAEASATEGSLDATAERVSEICVTESDGAEITYYTCEDAPGAEEAASACVEDIYYISEGGAIAQEAASAGAEGSRSREWSAEDAAEYAAYAPYGLRCDAAARKLYYLGEPVRVFEDAYSVDGGVAGLGYFDEEGTVDVRSIRDDKGDLTGLEALSDAEFAARDLREWTDPEPSQMEIVATGGSEPTLEERAAFFAPYAPFGLRYDAEQDRLYVNDRPVREFLDVRSSNGEPQTNGKFEGALTQLRFDGEVDVTILRDYGQPDANGEGKIIGIEVTEQG